MCADIGHIRAPVTDRIEDACRAKRATAPEKGGIKRIRLQGNGAVEAADSGNRIEWHII